MLPMRYVVWIVGAWIYFEYLKYSKYLQAPTIQTTYLIGNINI